MWARSDAIRCDKSIWSYYKNWSHMSMNQCPEHDATDSWSSFLWCGKRVFLHHFDIKTIILPRQARDKHRENSKTDVFLQARRRQPEKRRWRGYWAGLLQRSRLPAGAIILIALCLHTAILYT